MIKISKVLIWITVPFFLLILFASILTTKPYLLLSKGLYESHDDVYYNHNYGIDRIIGYLNYEYDDLEFGVSEYDDTVIMEDIEISHMVDVKVLYTNLRIGAIISLFISGFLILYLYKYNKEELYKALKNIYLGPMFFVVFVGGYIIIDFNKAFVIFHELFFTNDDWRIPYNVLLPLLPENFWMVSGLIILVLFSATIGLIYYLNERYLKKSTLK